MNGFDHQRMALNGLDRKVHSQNRLERIHPCFETTNSYWKENVESWFYSYLYPGFSLLERVRF